MPVSIHFRYIITKYHVNSHTRIQPPSHLCSELIIFYRHSFVKQLALIYTDANYTIIGVGQYLKFKYIFCNDLNYIQLLFVLLICLKIISIHVYWNDNLDKNLPH